MAESKVILVTGASRGLGYAISKFLINQPAKHKLVLSSRTSQPLEELKAIAPERISVNAGDITDTKYVDKMVELAVSKFGRLDSLILNHGTLGDVKRISELDIKSWQDTFQTNFFSCVYTVKVAIPELRKTHGRIIMTSSGAATNAYTGWGPYGATKAAMNHLVISLKAEEPSITTIAIRPGMVDTGMQQQIREVHGANMDETDLKKFTTAFKDGKLVKPEQAGQVIARLSIEAPTELSGSFLPWNDESLKSYQNSDKE